MLTNGPDVFLHVTDTDGVKIPRTCRSVDRFHAVLYSTWITKIVALISIIRFVQVRSIQ